MMKDELKLIEKLVPRYRKMAFEYLVKLKEAQDLEISQTQLPGSAKSNCLERLIRFPGHEKASVLEVTFGFSPELEVPLETFMRLKKIQDEFAAIFDAEIQRNRKPAEASLGGEKP